jgi:hypothetical protein
MKKFKLTIVINKVRSSVITSSTHTAEERLNDIVDKALKECEVKKQKYIIIMSGGQDDGNCKLTSYNESALKKNINVVLKECF